MPTLPLDNLRPYVQDVWDRLNGIPSQAPDFAANTKLSIDLATHARALDAARTT